MFAITMIAIGVMLLSLFFLFGGHRSRLHGASKKITLASDVTSESLSWEKPTLCANTKHTTADKPTAARNLRGETADGPHTLIITNPLGGHPLNVIQG